MMRFSVSSSPPKAPTCGMLAACSCSFHQNTDSTTTNSVMGTTIIIHGCTHVSMLIGSAAASAMAPPVRVCFQNRP